MAKGTARGNAVSQRRARVLRVRILSNWFSSKPSYATVKGDGTLGSPMLLGEFARSLHDFLRYYRQGAHETGTRKAPFRSEWVSYQSIISECGSSEVRMSEKKQDVGGRRAEAAPKDRREQPEWANGLKKLYDSVVDEPLPDSFKDLLSRLDDAKK